MFDRPNGRGLMATCMTCIYQERDDNDGQDASCICTDARPDDVRCSHHQTLPLPLLADRVVELYEYLELSLNLTYALMDVVERRLP